MKSFALLCDLHLTDAGDSVKVKVLRWALQEARNRGVEAIVCAGDMIGAGTPSSARFFRKLVSESGLPLFLTPGNAERRQENSYDEVAQILWTPQTFGDLLLLDTSTGRLSAESRDRLLVSGKNCFCVTHLPLSRLASEERALIREHSAMVAAGHLHRDCEEEGCLVLRGLDPDKVIGGPPAFSVFERDSVGLWRYETIAMTDADPTTWSSLEKESLRDMLGISTMATPLQSLAFAAKEMCRVVELRWNTLQALHFDDLRSAVGQWRDSGGRILSLHLPDLRWDQAGNLTDDSLAKACNEAVVLGCDRVTLHVPRISGKTLSSRQKCEKLRMLFADRLTPLIENNITIGIENLHMRSGESPEERDFGYTIEECRMWINELRDIPGSRVGFHFDIGHARNNVPYSTLQPLSDWYAALGRECCGMHLHQVALKNDGTMENHAPLTEFFGSLISLGSLFLALRTGQLGNIPLILEIRGGRCEESWKRLRNIL